ncbi:MAG: FecR family protein [Sphingobacteriaceae bacterium]|nr:MAG: FecR family protein [Sphingobacteriaceae bacterium]
MDRSKLEYLYQQYLNNNYTVEELQEFKLLLNDAKNEAELQHLMDQSWVDLPDTSKHNLPEVKADAIYTAIISKKQSNKTHFKSWMAIAAAALLFISVALFLKINADKRSIATTIANTKNSTVKEVSSHNNKIVLTFGNGEKIFLNDVRSGQIAKFANISIQKITDGQLAYIPNKSTENTASAKAEHHTITVPKGNQYHLSLPDGTQVFLNSESSLTYPVAFSGDERSVILKGEAYFEVAKNAHLPFVVDVNGKQKIQVLGTHFNVEGYADENVINTTLLEGSVKILSAENEAILKPGQMAVNQFTQPLKIKQANLEEVMAWKNGLFIFNNESIASIMKKISRWYNVDVVYAGNLENVKFVGNYARSKSLTNLLKSIALMDKVHFKIEEGRITVIENKYAEK